MFDNLKETCSVCNKNFIKFFMYDNKDSYLCPKCKNTFIQYNNSIKGYSISEIKQSIKKQKSIKTIKQEEKRLEYIRNSQMNFNNELDNIKNIQISLSETPTKKLFASNMPEYTFSNVTKATNLEKLSDYIVLDVETTGLNCRSNSIIEVSAIKFQDFEPIECFSTLINPNASISSEITNITGITDDMVKDAPYFYQILPDLNKFIGNYNIVGHNLEFDLKFLYVNGVDFFSTKRKFYDTLDLAHRAIKNLIFTIINSIQYRNFSIYIEQIRIVQNQMLMQLV